MSDDTTARLLVRDREQLDRVAKHLKRDHHVFFGIVCPADIVVITLDYLRAQSGKNIPSPIPVTNHDELVPMLQQLELANAGDVVSVKLAAQDVEAWTTLNWNREKLLRGGRLLLFMDSIDDLLAFHQYAPDAYSFRESVCRIEGVPAGAPTVPEELGEPFDIRTTRTLYELKKRPDERAEAAIAWVRALLGRGRIDEAITVATEALTLIPEKSFDENVHRRTRIRLLDMIPNLQHLRERLVRAFRAAQGGLHEVRDDQHEHFGGYLIKFELARTAASPLESSRPVLDEIARHLTASIAASVHEAYHFDLMRSAKRRGHFRIALAQFDKLFAGPAPSPWSRATYHSNLASTYLRMGRFDLVRKNIMAADEIFFRANFNSAAVGHKVEIHLLLERGELEAAEYRALAFDDITEFTARIAALRGDMPRALAEFDTLIKKYEQDERDGDVTRACSDLISLFRSAYTAQALSPASLERALKLLDAAGQWRIRLAAHDPPWYDVFVPSERARLLVLFEDRRDEALGEAQNGVKLAQSQWRQALPRALRVQVQCLAHANNWKKMKDAIVEGMQTARTEDDYHELSLLQAYDLARMVRKNAMQEQIDTARRVLEETFSTMAAPRVEAETWLEIAPYLPLDATSCDVVPIAERMYDLLTDMPMPEYASRAMEWLGDAQAARGDRTKAENAYRMALTPLKRHGFGLRRPLLEKKLGG